MKLYLKYPICYKVTIHTQSAINVYDKAGRLMITFWAGSHPLAYTKKEIHMLKGISPMLSPELLKILCEMGHSDTIVIADGNFPAETMGKNGIVLRMDGHGVPEILEAILQVFPLDQYVEKPVSLMERVPGDNADVSIWKTYEKMIEKEEQRGVSVIRKLERFEFYEEAKKAYCVIATSETSQYANVILQKGCVL